MDRSREGTAPEKDTRDADARGMLSKTPLLHLLVYSEERQLSGTLELGFPMIGRVLLDRGRVVQVETAAPVAYLGHVLLELELIDESVLLRSQRALLADGGLAGRVLVDEGLISPSDLDRGLRMQLDYKLLHLFLLPSDTPFAFFSGVNLLSEGYSGAEVPSYDAYAVFFRGVSAAPHLPSIDATLARVKGGYFTLDDRALARLAFRDAHALALQGLAVASFTEEDLHRAWGESPETVRLLLYLLLVTRALRPVSRPSAPPPDERLTIGLVPVARRVQEAAPASAPDPQACADGSPDGKRLEVVELTARLDKLDYFQLLGVSYEATREQIDAAYLALARSYHPDRLLKEHRDLTSACDRITAALNDAHRTLIDEKSRANYMRLVREGGATPEAQAYIARVVEAATTFRKAEVCLKVGDTAQAEALCRKAHEDDPSQADYVAMLAWIDSQKLGGDADPGILSLIAVLDGAIERSPRCARAYYYRGMLYKRMGKSGLSKGDFEQAAKLTPRDVDVQRELRSLERHREASSRETHPPVGPPTQSRLAGLLGVFKKRG
jgi:curved DNA-binding protein CbpA